MSIDSEEEETDEYQFPLTLKPPKKGSGGHSPIDGALNGTGAIAS